MLYTIICFDHVVPSHIVNVLAVAIISRKIHVLLSEAQLLTLCIQQKEADLSVS